MDRKKAKILGKLISLEMTKGHLRWKVTDLSRLSGASRSMIYYHFGKTKKEIFEHGFQMIAEEFYGLSDERAQMVKSGELLKSVLITRKMFLENPTYGIFYLKWRTTPSPLQKKCLELERRYQKRLHKIYSWLSRAQISALHSFLHGIVTAPFLSDSEVATAVHWITEEVDVVMGLGTRL